jgi:hypothetical protein
LRFFQLTAAACMMGCLIIADALPSAAESPWLQPVGRHSDSRSADLIAALIDQLRLDEAQEICLWKQKSAAPNSDDAALWAIRLSQVNTKRYMSGERFDDQQIAAAQQPVADLLNSYSDHPRALFLEAQQLAVARDAARHAVVVASVNPAAEAVTDKIFTALARVTSQVKELSQTVDAARATSDSNANTLRDRALSSDLLRLHQELLIDVVSLALLQTELFPGGSRDHIASANRAEQAAQKALLQLPPDTPARVEIERLRVEAILRSGQYDRAAGQLDQLMRMVGLPLPATMEALRLRLDIARDRLRDAGQRITEFYGSSVSSAPKSVEMDLARLEFLLASPDPQVGDWIEQIERRNGAFARRRAESIALARLRSTGNRQHVDASIVAAQGQDWLRRGNPQRAAEFLVAAARAEQQPDRAITRAAEAAAALIAAQRTADAAEILAEVSLANPGGKNASAAHLQSAHLHAADQSPEFVKQVEARLRQIVNQWPNSSEAEQARSWLIKLLTGQRRFLAAAQAATDLPPGKPAGDSIQRAAQLWRVAVRESQPEDVNKVGRLFLESFQPLLPAPGNAFAAAAAFVLDEDLLSEVDDSVSSAADDYTANLLAFRRSAEAPRLAAPPAELLDDTIWRLMRDGRRNRQLRQRNAATIQSWGQQNAANLGQVERLIWLGEIDSAITSATSLAGDSATPGKILTAAAQLFTASEHRQAKLEAIKLWDQIAAGVAKGSSAWHQARLQAIKLLSATGQVEQAVKRAKFVLLTSPPADQAVRRQYESVASQQK